MQRSRLNSSAHGFYEDVQQNEHNTYPECGGRVTTDVTEVVCDECGVVLEEAPIDHGPEWRSFEDGDTDENRTGAPLTAARHDRGLSTEIGFGTDGNGNQLSQRKRRQLSRLRREHGRANRSTKRDRNRMQGFFDVRHVTDGLDLGDDLTEQACQLFRTAQQEDLLIGRSIEAIAAACVYAVCRCNGLPRTEAEVADASRCDQLALRNAYSVLNEALELPAKLQQPKLYVPRYASALDLPAATRRRAQHLAHQAAQAGVGVGCCPTGVAAACLLVVANEQGVPVTQVRLADIVEVTPNTIRAHRDRLREELDVHLTSSHG